MKRAFLFLFLPLALLGTGAVNARAQSSVATDAGAAPYNALVLQQIRAMPSLGGYSANHQASVKLGSAVSLGGPYGIEIEAARAQPSYCSGATYLVFLKTVNALIMRGDLPADDHMFASLLINGQRDGEGIWGRWNANGPGTARLFYQLGLGQNFSDFAKAQPGDFMKIFWNDNVGKREHGHSVIFLGEETLNGVPSVHFWSSNVGMGYSDKYVPRSKISAAIFSRLTTPRALVRAPALTPKVDPYLASLTAVDSSLTEAARNCGM